ncbi:FAD-binding protein [Acrocarpospora catenulata]|uniref:FAD-binding protein n=1 Tax=Acrocarpospora catenulata TaxID=2836182 RepID=UPI001BD995E0|nr:FAD-binding protein [Acrocarpospora catenulata]
MTGTNWAGNVAYTASAIHRPATVAELQGLVAGGERIRALGTRHSFNKLADSTGELVELSGLPSVVEVDSKAATVRVSAGLRYADLGRTLHEHGFALPNLGSLPHISVAGACATGTHGSGVGNQNLSAAVSALELVTADGDLLTLTRQDPRFPGAVVALGALGVVTQLTLDLVPTFEVRQRVYVDLPLLNDKVDQILASAYSVSLFTDWREPIAGQIWVKRRDGDPAPDLTPAAHPMHPVPGMPPDSCTDQDDLPGPWYTRLPHFRPDRIPSAGDELQSEFMIARTDLTEALAALTEIRARIHPVLLISEIRTIAADDLWLSPCYQRDSAALHFTWKPDPTAVLPVVEQIETALAPFAPRPHWGKIFTRPGHYDRLDDFRALTTELDPSGKFGNTFLLPFTRHD